MNITSAQYERENPATSDYSAIRCTIDGEEMYVPLDTNNRHYNEILRQVAAGTLTIQDAD